MQSMEVVLGSMQTVCRLCGSEMTAGGNERRKSTGRRGAAASRTGWWWMDGWMDGIVGMGIGVWLLRGLGRVGRRIGEGRGELWLEQPPASCAPQQHPRLQTTTANHSDG